MSDGNLDERAERVRRNWFNALPVQRQDEIIKPAFETENNTPEKIREQAKRYCDDYGKEF